MALRAGYEIEDVEKLLDGGGDLPAELASSLRSDLIALGWNRGVRAFRTSRTPLAR